MWPQAHPHTPVAFEFPTSDGDIIEFTGASSEWDIFRRDGYGGDVPIIQEMMDAIEEEYNKGLDRKIRILGEALDALNNFSEFKNAKWFGRDDSWTQLYPGLSGEDDWPDYRTWAHFILSPLDGEISIALERAEEDRDYEAWINSKQYVKSLEAYNMHKLLACEKGQSPHWAGECTEDKVISTVITSDTVARSDIRVPTEKCVLYNTFLKERFKINTIIRTEFPYDKGNKAYAKASSEFGDVYVPYKFCGYIGQPGSPQLMTVALQDVGGNGRNGNGYRWTCIYTH